MAFAIGGFSIFHREFHREVDWILLSIRTEHFAQNVQDTQRLATAQPKSYQRFYAKW